VKKATIEELDVLVIGAGITGLYQLYCLLQQGFKARIYDAAEGVGGTWYWNRYPGARLDSESWSYAYSFSRELLQEWNWTENFVSQAELERYLNYVADKFQLRPHIQLGTRVRSAIFDEQANRWEVETEDGRRASARYVVAAVGLLSAKYVPDIPGIDRFAGTFIHTARWPHEPVDFRGKRVGIIGTGSTGVQIIPIVAKECAHLSVFQRTPNFCCPLRNSPIDAAQMERIKASYDQIFATCRANIAGFVHDWVPRNTLDVSPEEREATYERIWAAPGFAKWYGNFRDLMINREANDLYSEFVRNKIRARVKDPVLAEKLCPKDHHFGAKRVVLETDYYEAYNRDNVQLVDIREDPIQRITPTGLETQAARFDLDILICATGFDAATGEVTRIDIRGAGGKTIQEHWSEGPTMYLGLQTKGFPNLFFENGALFCNYTRCAEATAEFVSRCIAYLRDHGYQRIEPDPVAEAKWIEHAQFLNRRKLPSAVTNWAEGTNVPGKAKVGIFYGAGFAAYTKLCDEVAAKGYEGFVLE
jgi:cation diffusion facilitator CzcD-associated flavoprotein CzcO